MHNYTSNQTRTDDNYLEGRSYTNLTILVVIKLISITNPLTNKKYIFYLGKCFSQIYFLFVIRLIL